MIYNKDYIHKLPLHQYQKQAVNFIYQTPYAGLFLDVGMGKSLITLTALSCIKPENTLIIAPKAIARSTWIDEIDKWQAPLKYQSLIVDKNDKQYNLKQRNEQFEKVLTCKTPKLYFLNRDIVPKCVDFYFKKHKTWPFKYVVIDESQSFKSYSARRFKALKKVRPYIDRLIELTGTPTPNGLMDLWPQIYLLDEGLSLGRTITEYRTRFFTPVQYIQNHPVKWRALKTPDYDAEKDIYQRIKPMVISMKNTKLKLPKITYKADKVYLTDEEYETYRTLVNDKVIDLDQNIEVTAESAGALYTKLSQMASGALYIDNEHNFIQIHRHKLDMTDYIINNTSSPVIVAYHYKSDLKLLDEELTKLKIKHADFHGEPDLIKKWNAGEIPVLLLQPASAGFGLNLQKGGHTLIWYSMPTSLEQYIQTNGRIARQGQKYPVIIHHILTAKTVDLRILSALRHKDLSQNNLMNAVNYSLNALKSKGKQ